MSAKTSFQEFISRVKQVGLPTSTHFFTVIPDADKIQLQFCDSITMPGLSVMTQELRIFGELTELPHAPIYNQVTASYIMDNSGAPRDFFINWMNKVYDKEKRSPGYYDDYTKTIEIHLTDKLGNTIRKTRLHECYPKQISDIQLDYASGQIIKFSVNYIYKWYDEGQIAVTPTAYPLFNAQQTVKYISNIPVVQVAAETQRAITGVTSQLPAGAVQKSSTIFTPTTILKSIDTATRVLKAVTSQNISQAVAALASLPDLAINPPPGSGLPTINVTQLANNLLRIDANVRIMSDTISGIKDRISSTGSSVDLMSYRQNLSDAIGRMKETVIQTRLLFASLNVVLATEAIELTINQLIIDMNTTQSVTQMSERLKNFGGQIQDFGSIVETKQNELPANTGTAFKQNIKGMTEALMTGGVDIVNMAGALS